MRCSCIFHFWWLLSWDGWFQKDELESAVKFKAEILTRHMVLGLDVCLFVCLLFLGDTELSLEPCLSQKVQQSLHSRTHLLKKQVSLGVVPALWSWDSRAAMGVKMIAWPMWWDHDFNRREGSGEDEERRQQLAYEEQHKSCFCLCFLGMFCPRPSKSEHKVVGHRGSLAFLSGLVLPQKHFQHELSVWRVRDKLCERLHFDAHVCILVPLIQVGRVRSMEDTGIHSLPMLISEILCLWLLLFTIDAPSHHVCGYFL